MLKVLISSELKVLKVLSEYVLFLFTCFAHIQGGLQLINILLLRHLVLCLLP